MAEYMERWEEQANCKGKAFELFEYQEHGAPLAEGMKYKQRMEFNTVNYELAAEICIECPVMFICGTSATDEEKYWTVRGGEKPGRFVEESKRYEKVGRPKGSKNKHKARSTGGRFVANDGECARGHKLPPEGGRCKDCHRLARQRRDREARVVYDGGTAKPTG